MTLSRRDEAVRSTGIGGSEIGVLAGLSRWSSPIRVWERLVRGATTDDANLSTELGVELEEPVARVHAKRHGLYVRRCATLRHPQHAFAVASLDRAVWLEKVDTRRKVQAIEDLVGADRALEVKTTSWRMAQEWGPSGTDEVPEQYLAQVVWQMGVSGLRRAEVVVYFRDDNELRSYSVPWNEELWRGLIEIAGRFWRDHVETSRPPPPDASESYREFLVRAFPATTGPVLRVESGTPVDRLARWYAQLKTFEKRLTAELKIAHAEILTAIGTAAGIEGEFGSVKWLRSPAKSKLDHEARANALAQYLALLGETQPALRDGIAARLSEIDRESMREGKPYSQLRAKWADGIGAGATLTLSTNTTTDEESAP